MKLYLVLLLTFLTGACTRSAGDGDDTDSLAGNADSDTDSDTDGDTDTSNPGDTETTAYDHASDWVFDQNEVRTYRITMTPADRDQLVEHGNDEEYLPADLDVDGETWQNIGVRLKGSYSLDTCWNGMDERQWDGHCQKISMKLKFTEYDDTLRFHSLKKVNLHSMSADPSKMHERLGYYLFAEMDVPAPRTVPARVYLNDAYLGIFGVVEQVDGRFTAHRFPEGGDGNLYKEVWPDGDVEEQDIWDALKTNDQPEDSPNISNFIQFAADMASANGGNVATTIAWHMDVDQMLKYIVVDRAIHNWDGLMAFYWGGNHNYYWYQKMSGPWVLIPWDLDKAFFEYDRYMDPNPAEGIGYPVPNWNVAPNRCGLMWPDNLYTISESIGPPEEGPGTMSFVAPGCDPLIGTLAEVYWDDFTVHGQAFLDTVFTAANLTERLDEWEAQIDPVMQEEPTLTYAAWQAEMAALRSHIPKFRSDFAAHINDTYRAE